MRIGDFFVTQAQLQQRKQRARRAEPARRAGAAAAGGPGRGKRQLRRLLDARERLPRKSRVAEILYAGRDPFSRKVIIDKGSQNGISAGQPVIDDIGVIGQVTRVYPLLSEVTLITDKDQAIPVQVLRNGLRAVSPAPATTAQLDCGSWRSNADIQNGDKLVTSGIDGIYPPGLPVAEVSQHRARRRLCVRPDRLRRSPASTATRQVLVLGWEHRMPERAAPPDEARAGAPQESAQEALMRCETGTAAHPAAA